MAPAEDICVMVSAHNWCMCTKECVRVKGRETNQVQGEKSRKRKKKEKEILGVIYNMAAMLLPSLRVCGSSAVCVALRETPDKDRAGVATDALVGEIHLVHSMLNDKMISHQRVTPYV